MDRSLSFLKAANSLRALQFFHTGFCGGSSRDQVRIEELARHCTPLLRSLQATWKARSLGMDVLDVVKIVLPPCHCEICPEPRKRCHYFACRDTGTHSRCPFRWVTMPGGRSVEESCRPRDCLCEAADKKNRLFDEELRKRITSGLALVN